MFTAVVRVTGAGRLADFRERLRWLMVRDEDAEEYSEHHAEACSNTASRRRRASRFPAFTAASADFPSCRSRRNGSTTACAGARVIENGRLVQQAPRARGGHAARRSIEANGRLELALACTPARGRAASATPRAPTRHTYFRYRGGALELVGPDSPDEALEEVAFAFVEEWIWYDEEDAVLERARYANYGYPVHGANLRAEKLHLVRDARAALLLARRAAAEAREALVEQWLKRT
jgi:hypothetical protein